MKIGPAEDQFGTWLYELSTSPGVVLHKIIVGCAFCFFCSEFNFTLQHLNFPPGDL